MFSSPQPSFNFERDIARILKEQELVSKRMKEFEDGLAASKSPSQAKVGFAAIQEMARLQQDDPDDLAASASAAAPNDLSFLRFDPQSNRMMLESAKPSTPPTNVAEKPAKFPLEIPHSPFQSPNLPHKLRRMGSWR